MKVVIPEWMRPIYANFHYAPAVIVGDQLRCSGMIGIQPDLSVPADPTEQITLAFDNLRGLLGEVGLTFADVVEMTTYHVGLSEQIDRFVAVKDTYVSAPYPAWTAVGISELAIPGAVVEIRITAQLS